MKTTTFVSDMLGHIQGIFLGIHIALKLFGLIDLELWVIFIPSMIWILIIPISVARCSLSK